VVGQTESIFDTGSSLIIGDPDGIKALFDSIPGAQADGEGTYTSTLCNLLIRYRACSVFSFSPL